MKSATPLSSPLAFNDDVLLIPVDELPDEMRQQIDCAPDDFALSRPQARTGSKILDPETAELVGRFRQPRTLVEAVILFGKSRGVDPEEVLEEAFPLVKGLVREGFLVTADGGRPPQPTGRGLAAGWQPGQELAGAEVLRVLQVLEDTEVYLVQREGRPSVLKVERRLPASQPGRLAPGRVAPGRLAQRLAREAAFLAHLDGQPAPRLLDRGEVDSLAYLEMEYVAGIDAVTAGAEWRGEGAAGRRRLARLCGAVARAYAGLHARGVLHGDVHPSNVLVDGDGGIRLIDFGVARGLDGGLPATAERGGIPFFYEPELARAYLAGGPPPPASAAGEQYAVAALLYLLAAGAHPRDYSLGREEMLRQIAEAPPLPFAGRGAEPWPALEAVLQRGLAKEPEQRYPSMTALAEALAAVEEAAEDRARGEAGLATAAAEPASGEAAVRRSGATAGALDRMVREVVDAAGLDGPWWNEGLAPAPTASVTYGAAGLALGLLQIGLAQGEASLLSLADLWVRRAGRQIGDETGFYNADIDITPRVVGQGSPYHTASGVHAAAALVARAAGDPRSQGEALARYLEAVDAPMAGLDLTLGSASALLTDAVLLDAVAPAVDDAPLRAHGEELLAGLWRQLDAKAAIAEADIDYLGIAHGWAGFLYATLTWCSVAGSAVPAGVERRLEELAALALPAGRGLRWPWTLTGDGRTATMPGWCNGACGYVFLWTLAHRRLETPRYLDLAVGAAYEAFDAAEPAGSLCCGLAGRAYALLNLHRATGEALWHQRARRLLLGAAAQDAGGEDDKYTHSLWKGRLGLAAAAAELERPGQAAVPLFEPLGYGTAT